MNATESAHTAAPMSPQAAAIRRPAGEAVKGDARSAGASTLTSGLARAAVMAHTLPGLTRKAHRPYRMISSFRVRVGIANARVHPLAGRRAGEDAVGGMSSPHDTVRIVTVDDQPIFRTAAQALIASTPGFELVGESEDGESALALVGEADPDLVLVDVRMPGIDGIEVAARLLADDPTRVVVLASTLDPASLSHVARTCGAAAVVHKHWLTPRLLRGLWVAHRRR
jgi:CheY-like chemotaxis protein